MNKQWLNDDYETCSQRTDEKKVRMKKGLFWIKSILVLSIILTVLILFMISPLFNISRFQVQESVHYSQDILIDLSNIFVGDNGFKSIGTDINQIFGLRYGESEKNILKYCPYIKNVKVKYIIPNSVKISFTEREPVGSIAYLGANLVIDNEGYILDTVKDISLHKLPEIKGLKFSYYDLGKKLLTENPKNLEEAIEVLDIIRISDEKDRFKLLNMINSIDVGDLNKISITIDSRIILKLGDIEDLEYKIAATKQILLNSTKKEDKGLLDFTIGENPTFIPDKNN